MAKGGVSEIKRLAQRRLQAEDRAQARGGELRVPVSGTIRVVGMRLERRDTDVQPVPEWEVGEQTIELGPAVGPVHADGLGLSFGGGLLPEPDQMPLLGQLGGRDRLAVLTILDLRRGSSIRDVDVELDEEFHCVTP
jgi:glycine/D-amino acid oxidase-like deaminating enzyme